MQRIIVGGKERRDDGVEYLGVKGKEGKKTWGRRRETNAGRERGMEKESRK